MIEELNVDILQYCKNLNKDDFILAHCISNDWVLGAGIAKYLDNKLNIKSKKKELNINSKVCDCIIVDCDTIRVANLITKAKYYQKPTYETLFKSIDNLVSRVDKNTKLVIPKIGCGLDKLDWNKVKDYLSKLEREIVVCYV